MAAHNCKRSGASKRATAAEKEVKATTEQGGQWKNTLSSRLGHLLQGGCKQALFRVQSKDQAPEAAKEEEMKQSNWCLAWSKL